ncbi:Uncharacterised protein [Mycobacteroides abscessus subsp. abscessus]|nr:Uncharacterised protein [Mycobacteroides abscessus subsp. abscessus]
MSMMIGVAFSRGEVSMRCTPGSASSVPASAAISLSAGKALRPGLAVFAIVSVMRSLLSDFG